MFNIFDDFKANCVYRLSVRSSLKDNHDKFETYSVVRQHTEERQILEALKIMLRGVGTLPNIFGTIEEAEDIKLKYARVGIMCEVIEEQR